MSFTKQTLRAIDRGREGINKGIPISLPRLSENLCGIQKHESYLIGAPTGIGKSTLGDDIFIYDSFEYYKKVKGTPDEINLKIDYFSFEMEKTNIVAKGIVRLLAREGIILKWGINEILSRGKHRISDEIYNKVKEKMEYFEELEDVMEIYDEAENPTGVYSKIKSNTDKLGQTTYRTIKNYQGKEIKIRDKYKLHKDNTYQIALIDHIALCRGERGFNRKQTIDKMSEYLLQFRKFNGVIPVVIQQLNYDIDNPERVKSGRITPMLSDFGDSKYTTRDFSNVISLFNPYDKQIADVRGISVKEFGGQLVLLDLLKCRYGINNVQYPLWFKAPSATFEELPSFKELKDSDTLNQIIKRIEKYETSN